MTEQWKVEADIKRSQRHQYQNHADHIASFRKYCTRSHKREGKRHYQKGERLGGVAENTAKFIQETPDSTYIDEIDNIYFLLNEG